MSFNEMDSRECLSFQARLYLYQKKEIELSEYKTMGFIRDILPQIIFDQSDYDTHEPIREGVHLYANSRKDGKDGYVYILINNSKTEKTSIEIPAQVERYTLSATDLRSKEILLNGKPLTLEGECKLPTLNPVTEEAGVIELDPATITFLVI